MVRLNKLQLYSLRTLVALVCGVMLAYRFFPFPFFTGEAADTSILERYVIEVKTEDKKDDVVEQVKGKKFIAEHEKELKVDFENDDSKWVGVTLKQSEVIKAKSNPDVVRVEKDLKRKILATPNDPLYSSDQWDLRKIQLNTLQASTPPPSSATSGWDISTGSSSVTIAVIDTGYDVSHPDMQGNVWTNIAEVANNGVDDDGNGYVDDRNGFDFSCDDNNNDGDCVDPGDRPRGPDVYDYNGHGSHVSGTIGATANNAKGVTGICWSCKVMPLKVINSNGYGFDSDIADAIYYAADNGAKVINMSLGGGGYSQLLQDAVDYAWTVKDVVVVSASGNDGKSASDSYPSGLDRTISVGATDSLDNTAGYSNTGPKMDLVAPGSNIASTIPCSRAGGCGTSGTYAYLDGTSMASPHVAGVVGLIRSYYPGWDAFKVRYALLKNIQDLGTTGFNNSSGFGRLDALKSLQATSTIGADSTSPLSSLQPSPANVSGIYAITGTASDANLYIYTISVSRQSDGYIIKQVSGRSSVTSGTLYSLDTAETKTDANTGVTSRIIPDGSYYVTMKVEDFIGHVVDSNVITMNVNNVFPTAFSLTAPANNTWVNTARPAFSWQTSTDTSSGVLYDLYIDNSVFASNINATNYTPGSNILQGIHTWKVGAKNTSGNTTFSNTLTIKIDTSNPTGLTTNATVSTYYPTITFSASDSVSGIEHYGVSINGGSYTTATSPYTPGPLVNGGYTYDVRAYDYAGNYGSASGGFTINVTDAVNPTGSLNAPGQYIRGNYQFTGSATDNNVVNTYTISIKRASDSVEFGQVVGNGNVSNGNLGTPFNTIALADGDYKALMTVADMAGNTVDSNEITFTIDNTVPSAFSLMAPTSGLTVTNNKPTFTWFASTDNYSSIVYDMYLDSNLVLANTSGGIYTPANALSDGTHSWYVVAKDVAGNTRSTNVWNFTVDTRTQYLRSKADFTGNGKVDLSDLSILAQNWQKTTSQGDANGDGKVDLTDLSILAQNWQKNF